MQTSVSLHLYVFPSFFLGYFSTISLFVFTSLLSLRDPLVFLSRDRKGMDLDGKRDGEERGGSGGRGNCNQNILYF